VEALIGDSSKARRVLNWKPSYAFAELVSLMVRNDLEFIARGSLAQASRLANRSAATTE
jgi:GDPmannose 4,6-dehydratase